MKYVILNILINLLKFTLEKKRGVKITKKTLVQKSLNSQRKSLAQIFLNDLSFEKLIPDETIDRAIVRMLCMTVPVESGLPFTQTFPILF